MKINEGLRLDGQLQDRPAEIPDMGTAKLLFGRRRRHLLPHRVVGPVHELLTNLEELLGAIAAELGDGRWSDGARQLERAIAALKEPSPELQAARAAEQANFAADYERARLERDAEIERLEAAYHANLVAQHADFAKRPQPPPPDETDPERQAAGARIKVWLAKRAKPKSKKDVIVPKVAYLIRKGMASVRLRRA